MRDRLPSMRTLNRKVMSRSGPCTVELILGVDSIRMACAKQICAAPATSGRISNRQLRWEKAANKPLTSHLHLRDRRGRCRQQNTRSAARAQPFCVPPDCSRPEVRYTKPLSTGTYKPLAFEGPAQLVKVFDEGAAKTRQALASLSDRAWEEKVRRVLAISRSNSVKSASLKAAECQMKEIGAAAHRRPGGESISSGSPAPRCPNLISKGFALDCADLQVCGSFLRCLHKLLSLWP